MKDRVEIELRKLKFERVQHSKVQHSKVRLQRLREDGYRLGVWAIRMHNESGMVKGLAESGAFRRNRGGLIYVRTLYGESQARHLFCAL